MAQKILVTSKILKHNCQSTYTFNRKPLFIVDVYPTLFQCKVCTFLAIMPCIKLKYSTSSEKKGFNAN